MVDLYGSACYWGGESYTSAGNFSSARNRYLYWRLAGYYLVKESAPGTGVVYFNPNFCIDTNDPAHGLDFFEEWLPAFDVDVGVPTDEPAVLQTGTAAGCDFAIFQRHLSEGLVLVRPKGGWGCDDYGDDSAASVVLETPMRILLDDGTLSGTVDTVTIRNGEALILMP
jgi:hypothetical protein